MYINRINLTHLQQDCLSVEGLPIANTIDRHVLRAAAMQARISHERNVRLSVRPSAKRVNCGKTKETSAKIPIIPALRQGKWLVGDDHFYLKFWAKQYRPRWSKNADFQSICDRSASAVTPCEKSSIITSRRSITWRKFCPA